MPPRDSRRSRCRILRSRPRLARYRIPLPIIIMGGLALLALILPGCCSIPEHHSRVELSAAAPINPDAIRAGRAPLIQVSAKYTIEFGGSPSRKD